ncbi:MAG: ABC transporter ATP-binding protein [Bacillota bacterium]
MLELKDVSLTIEGEKGAVEILHNINLTLEDRRFYVITGPNGGGKSSLAKLLMGIYRPTYGRIILDGQDITDLGITERARLGVGYAFQQPPRFKGLTVKELLQLAGGKNSFGNVCNYLFDVGLCPQDYQDREVDASLSGGELKRIEIATLLARKLKVALYDEPEAGIDLWSFSRLTETFKTMHKKYATTMIIISHQERILSLADEIIMIAEGSVKQKGTKEQIWPLIMDEAGCACSKDCIERADNNAECNR